MSSATCCCPCDDALRCVEIRYNLDLEREIDWSTEYTCECVCHDKEDEEEAE